MDQFTDHLNGAASGGLVGLLLLGGERVLRFLRRDRAEARNEGAQEHRIVALEQGQQRIEGKLDMILNHLLGGK